MVSWDSKGFERLVAALIAANPGIKLDYNAIAAMFGQGATYDTIEYRFRSYRKLAEKLKAEAAKNGVSLDELPRGRQPAKDPQTPRGCRNRISKASSSSIGKCKKNAAKGLATPSKSGSKNSIGHSALQAILVHSDEDDDGVVKKEDEPKIKTEIETAGIVPSVEESDSETCNVDNTEAMDGILPHIKEDVFTNHGGNTSYASRRMTLPPQDNSHETMHSGNSSPTPQRRSCSRNHLPRASRIPRAVGRHNFDSSDDETI